MPYRANGHRKVGHSLHAIKNKSINNFARQLRDQVVVAMTTN